MEENKDKKVIDLGILSHLKESGVAEIALVEEPAIELDFLYFNKEEFGLAIHCTCDCCGWDWDLADGGDKPYLCHKCGCDNTLSIKEAYNLDDACWKGYEPIGVKKKNGRTVPNCVPVKSEKFESYNDYPESAKNAAKRALKWRDENPDQKCGTAVGWTRANQLAKGENISEETISRMASFKRHQQHKDVPYSEGCGGLMWDCWGGTAGIEWASNKLEEIREDFDIDTAGLAPYVDPGVKQKRIEDTYSADVIETILKLASVLGTSADNVKIEAFKFAEVPKDAEAVYKYQGRIRSNSRRFCANFPQDRFFSREDIDAMDGLNTEFGPGAGGGQYSIFKYKGGANCGHSFQKYYKYKDEKGVDRYQLATPDNAQEMQAATALRNQAGNGYVKRPQRSNPALGGGRDSFSKIKELEFKFADDEKRIVIGPAMIPNMEIPRKTDDGEKYYVRFSEETIREIAMKYMKEARTNATNTDHDTGERAGAYVYESWIVEDPKTDKAKTIYGYDVMKGTWMIAMKVDNPETWKRIKAGELKGFSVEGAFADMEEVQAQKDYQKIVNILKGNI